MSDMKDLIISVTDPQHTIDSIFEYLKNCGKEVFFAIDEFQTIADYREQGTEALLRSHIQFIHNVHFIFSGNRQHLMYEMFGSPKRPFYQSTAMMSFDRQRSRLSLYRRLHHLYL